MASTVWLMLTVVLGYIDGSPDQGTKTFVVHGFDTMAQCETYRASEDGRRRMGGMINEIAEKSVAGQKLTISNKCTGA